MREWHNNGIDADPQWNLAAPRIEFKPADPINPSELSHADRSGVGASQPAASASISTRNATLTRPLTCTSELAGGLSSEMNSSRTCLTASRSPRSTRKIVSLTICSIPAPAAARAAARFSNTCLGLGQRIVLAGESSFAVQRHLAGEGDHSPTERDRVAVSVDRWWSVGPKEVLVHGSSVE